MPKDIMGRELMVGQTVVHAQRQGNSGALAVRVVTKVEGNDVWVRPEDNPTSNGRKVWFLDRLAVVED